MGPYIAIKLALLLSLLGLNSYWSLLGLKADADMEVDAEQPASTAIPTPQARDVLPVAVSTYAVPYVCTRKEIYIYMHIRVYGYSAYTIVFDHCGRAYNTYFYKEFANPPPP